MGLIGEVLAETILSRYEWHHSTPPAGYEGGQKLEILFGPKLWANRIAHQEPARIAFPPGPHPFMYPGLKKKQTLRRKYTARSLSDA
jgi:hypothetical protein